MATNFQRCAGIDVQYAARETIGDIRAIWKVA